MAFWRGLTPKLSSGGLLGTILGKPIKRLPSAAADCSALVQGAAPKGYASPLTAWMPSIRLRPHPYEFHMHFDT